MKRCIAYPARLALGAGCFLILLGMEILYLSMGNLGLAAAFGLLTILYSFLNAELLTTVRLSREGAAAFIPGISGTIYNWSAIQEVGVLYADPIRRRKKDKRAAACRIYLSPRALTPEERLQACISWPKDVIGLQYTPERLRVVTKEWKKELELFNISSKELFGDGNIRFGGLIHETKY